MGQEIVYCSECALRLVGADFDKGKAFRVEHKSLCAPCAKKILGSLPPVEGPKSTSQRIPIQKSTVESGSHARLRPSNDTTVSRGLPSSPKKSSGPLIAAAVGVLVVLAIVVAVASSGGGPPPPPKTSDPGTSPDDPSPREAEARAALDKALAYARTNPSDLDGQLSRLQELAFKADGTSLAERVKAETEAARLRAHQTVSREIAVLESRVKPLLAAKDVAAARHVLEGERRRFVSRDWDIAVRRLLGDVEATPAVVTPPPAADLWTVLDLQELRSARGTPLEKRPDGSVLAGGAAPRTDVYEFSARSPLKSVTALRIEALPDPSLPGGGPGRSGNGNSVLSEIRVESGGRPVAFAGVSGYDQWEWPASAMIDGHPLTGWGQAPRFGTASEAVLHAKEPFDGAALSFILEFQSLHDQHTLGRFRISATSAALPAPPGPRATEATYANSRAITGDDIHWHNWSWGCKVEARSSAVPPFDGASSVAIEFQQNSGALYLGLPDAVELPPYLSFAVYRVDESSFPYGLCLYGAGEKEHSEISTFDKLGGPPPVRQWRRYVIPTSLFKLPSGKIRGLVLQNYYPKFPAPTLYLDALQLHNGPVLAAPETPAVAAYRARWGQAALLAAGRDLDAALKLLKEAPASDETKKEQAEDLADLERLRALHEEVRALLQKWPKGWNLAVDVLDAAGAARRVDEPVRRVDARGLELRSGEILEPGRILAPSLAELFLARPKKAETDARAAALLCAIEGFPEAAKRLFPGALKTGPPLPEDADARRFYLEAEEEYRGYATRARALEKFAILLKSHGETPFLRRLRTSIQARLDAPRDFVYAPSDLRPSGAFQVRRHEKGEIAWTLTEDVEKASRKDHALELEYSAPPGTEPRGWVLVGGCCQEVFTFHLQGTDVEGPDADNPSTVVKCDPEGALMTPVHPAGVTFLKRTHASHGGKKETERFAWVALPPLKRGGPGTQAKLRILADHQAFAVAAVLISSARKAPPKAEELEELLAPRPFLEPELGESGVRGLILREIWKNIGGDKVADLVNNPRFKEAPDLSHRVGGLDSWSMGDSYGTRFRGWIFPPLSGNYVFWLASDDNSELWLSDNESPGDKKKILAHNGAVGHREWGRGAKSGPVPLLKGRRYYVEALHKQGGGNEHVAVGWTLPDGTEERPILGHRLMPWSAAAAARAGAQLDVPREHTAGTPLPMAVTTTVAANARIEIYNGSARLAEAKGGAYTWAQPTAGAHLLSARVIERNGKTVLSPPALVVVGELHFLRGVDFNGAGGTIDDRPWSSGSGAPGFEAPEIELRPVTDAPRAKMIRNSVALRDGAKAVVGLPNGKSLIYATLWAPIDTAPFDLAINGKTVLSGHRFAAVGEWARLGPWSVEVADGKIELTSPKGTAHVSGVDVWSPTKPAPSRNVNTAEVGGQGGAPFAELGGSGALLIGFRASIGGNQLQALRGIYRLGERVNDGPSHGVTRHELREILAKPGYAVGGVKAKGADRVTAFNVVFMKVKGPMLDPADSYESGWLVGDGNGAATLGGDGYPVIGLIGRHGNDLDALGLIQFKP